MNLPNKLTVLRLILIPFYIFFLMTDFFRWTSVAALVVFAAACITDMLDGQIARRKNMITDFGKFADPLADKILVISAMVCFVDLGIMPSWVCIIILAREFAVSGLRLVAAAQGIVLAASWWGKFKTTSQMILCLLMTFDIERILGRTAEESAFVNAYNIITIVIMYIALVLTLISMFDYFYRNRGSISVK